MRSIHYPAMLTSLLLAGTACGSSTGPGTLALDAVSPAPASTLVSPVANVTLTFSAGMATGMEQFIDLHVDSLGGPVIPMTCGWNGARTIVTCTHAPLAGGTTYVIHMGGGLQAMSGAMVDFDTWTMTGATRMMSGMMSGMHDGQPIGMMGSGWHHGSDYGLECIFTTA